MIFPWDWSAFIVGCIGAFIMEFVRIIKDNKSLTQVIVVADSYLRMRKVNIVALLIIVVYVAIGGLISGMFANTIQEAFLYGVFWEVLFTFSISDGVEK